ncbi:hypothetical protein SteCoe_16274 [Stentor coeruleus]|uniref:NB-ARC domain-containing protein n=1 Tax=Stentor coeruleus TaxID=5963 RepID=A0A1R2C1T0_9CILI|nr:hypothetical protein SteCoe_16274 [Stentor coeruleus]
MKILPEISLELVLEKRYTVKIACVGHAIKTYSKDLQSFREWSGPIIGLSINMLAWLKEKSTWAISRFSINPKTLEVMFLTGLKGGGVRTSKNKALIMIKQIETDPDILIELKENQKKAMELAKSISESMGEMTIEMSQVSSLGKLSPFKCFSPYTIAMKLFENFDATQCWTEYAYSEERAAIALIARKFLMVFFIKNEEVKFLSKLEKNELLARFDKVINIIELNEKQNPELCTLVEVQIMKKLINNANDTQKWWRTALLESKDILVAAIGLKNFDPTAALKKSIEYFEKIKNKVQGSFHRYAFQFEIIEKQFTTDAELKDQIQGLIITELEKVNQLKWQEVHILLDFFENCVKQEKISEEFILRVIVSYIQNLRENKAWQVREKVVNLLRSLGGHWNQEISQESKKIYEIMKLNETDMKVKKILSFSLRNLVKITAPNERAKTIDFISNKKDSTDLIIGREDAIQEIDKRLKIKNILAITGMGGIGKTSVALKYADDYRSDYQVIWIINGDNIEADLIYLAVKLGIPKDNDTLENFKTELSSQKIKQSMLLVFDNLEENTQIKDYYVMSENIKYLITSRNTGWENIIELGPLSYDQSEDYLTSRLLEQKESKESIKALAQRMDGYALGLRQSVASIKKNKFTINEYLEFIEDLSADETICKTLESIVQKFTSEALNALELLSYFQPQDIPEEIIKSILVEKYGVREWLRVRSQLIGCYIINKSSEGYWNVHRIIMDFIQGKNKGEMKDLLVQYYYKNPIDCNNIYSNKSGTEKVKIMINHRRVFTKKLELNSNEEIEICLNANEANFEIQMNFKETEIFLEEIINKKNQISKDEKKSTADIWYQAGVMYQKLCKYEKSEEFYKKCLEIREQILPPLHTHLAIIYTSMGSLYFDKLDYIQSEKFHTKCLEIMEQTLPPFHPQLAGIYMGMGNLYTKKKDFIKSDKFYTKCLEIQKQTLPPLHPQLAALYLNMGNLYCDMINYMKSEEFYTKCLEIQKQILPPLHPDLATLYMSMGILYNDKGDYMKSQEFYMKCLEIQEQILPPLHPSLAKIYMNMGIFYNDKKDYMKSEEFYTKCLEIQKQILPPLHPQIAGIYMNIGKLYADKADYMKSEEFCTKCLEIQEQILPPLHPDLTITYENLGILNGINGDYMKSEEFYKKCIEIREQILPPSHPDLSKVYIKMAQLYEYCGNFLKSEEFYMKHYKIELSKNNE